MTKKARGLTRSITRKQALSYTRLKPNGLGVTAIASVNGRGSRRKAKRNHRRPISDRHGGFRRNAAAVVAPAAAKANRRKKPKKRGAYAKRYAQTKMILRSPQRGPTGRPSRKRIHGIPPYMVGGQFPVIVPPAPKRRRRASRPKETVMKRKSHRGHRKASRSPAQRAAFKKMMAGLARYKKKSHPRRAKARKTTHRRSKARRSPAQRSAFKKMIAGLARYKRKRPAKRRRHYTSNRKGSAGKSRSGRVYSGYKSATARVGKRRIPTYVFQSKKGKLKHIPLYAIAGAKSKAQVRRILSKGGKRADQYRKRIGAINRQRTRASSRVALHGDIFTPNRKGIVVPYETWSDSMTPNRKRRRSKKSHRKASTHHKRRKSAARRPKVHRTRKASRRTAARKAAKTRALKHEMRSRAAKKAARTRKRRHGGGRKKAHRNRRRHHAAMVPNRRRHHRRHRKNARRAAAATPNRRRRHHRRVHRNRRRSSYLPVRVARIHYASNRRRHHRRRHYRANFRSGAFMNRIKEVLKVGALVAFGFGAHRAATKILSDQVLAKMGFSTGPLATYRGLIAGAIVAGLSIPLADKVFKKKAGEFNSGVFASLIHSLVTTVLNAAGQGPIAAALSAYPDAEGRAYHGMMGMGEYMPVNGFGAYEMAGFGGSPLLSQAAAGFGDIATRTRYGGSQISQAAAGFGGPMITQAAAGTGEYLASGVQGIGDYEMVSGVGGSFGATDEGIRPDLRSAERALNIAEAAAGVSLGDLPTASQLNPVMLAQPVEDAPEGMRAGILQGGDGIFG